jgi:serine/threonine protein kinase
LLFCGLVSKSPPSLSKWLGLEFLGKLESSQSIKHSRENALQYLPYDDKAAEFDIAKFAKRLAHGFSEPAGTWQRLAHFLFKRKAKEKRQKQIKVVFVFDELDKLSKHSKEGPDVFESLLESLKGVFTSNPFSFVFIAGKEVYQRWTEDVALGDSIYESIFAYNFYVPCLWKEQEEFVQKCLADSAQKSEVQSPTWHLTRFLEYRGRGVLRRMLRELNNCVVWENDHPRVNIPPGYKAFIGVYSKLQEILTEKTDLFGIDVLRIDQARWDRWRLSLYYTLDWILATRGEPFSNADVIAAAANLKLGSGTERVNREDYARRIIRMLLDRGFVEPVVDNLTIIDLVNTQASRYRLCEWVVLALEQTADSVLEPLEVSQPPIQESPTSQRMQGRKRIGRYRIESVIGRGGMGIVFRCVSPEGVAYAVKVLIQSIASDAASTNRLFEHEIKVLSALRHPNIVKIIDYGIDHDQAFFVMEFVDGEPLNALLGRVRKCDTKFAIRIVRSAAETFSYVHEQGITRNDIKPSNMILTPKGQIKLVDFGIAAFMADTQDTGDNSNLIIGTPRYLSPERINGKPATVQSDVFSLGVVLYELITGQNPFDAEDSIGIAMSILNRDPIPPSQLVSLSAELNGVVMRALNKDPAKRFSSMLKFAEQLKRLEQPVDLVELLNLSRDVGDEDASGRGAHTVEFDASSIDRTEKLPLASPQDSETEEKSRRLSSESAENRVDAIRKIADSRDESAIPVLLNALHDSDMRIRLSAFWTLASLNPANVFDLLFDFVLDVCFFTNEEQAKVSLRKVRLTLGRLRSSDLFLQSRELSRVHLMILIQDGAVLIEVVNVGNGVRINGERVSRAELKDGDVLTIAAIQIRVHIHKHIDRVGDGSSVGLGRPASVL